MSAYYPFRLLKFIKAGVERGGVNALFVVRGEQTIYDREGIPALQSAPLSKVYALPDALARNLRNNADRNYTLLCLLCKVRYN